MKKLCYPVLFFILLSGLGTAQKIVISGRVLGSDGKILPKANVEFYDKDNNNWYTVVVNADGVFRYETEKKINYFKFSSVNHKSIKVPLIINSAPSVKFDILLPALSQDSNFSTVKINSETPNLPEIRILKEELENAAFVDSLRSEFAKKPDYYPDFASSIKPIIKKLEVEKDTVMREYYYFRYLYRAKRDLNGWDHLDSSIVVQALKQINPASDLWSLEPNLLFGVFKDCMNMGLRKLLEDYYDKVISLNKNPEVVAEALWGKAEEIKGYVTGIKRERMNPQMSREEVQELSKRVSEDYMKKNRLTEKEAQAHKDEIWSLYQAERIKILDAKRNRLTIGNGEIKSGKDSLAILEETAKECFERLKNEFQNTKRGRMIINEYFTIKSGQPVPEFALRSIDNSNLAYSDKSMKGKYYLIDFWASWCGPCIGEMPELHKAYEKLKGMNFEILSISFDYSDEAVAKFRKEKYPMPWLHTRLERNYDDELSKKFGVEGIPKMFLISPEGKILACNWELQGYYFIQRLESFITEDLKNAR